MDSFMKKSISRSLKFFALVALLSSVCFAQNNFEKEKKAENCSVFLKVEFLESGKIGDVSLISNTCETDSGLEEKALAAAKKIKFTPRSRNGKAVTETKQVRFDFSVLNEDVKSNLTDIRDITEAENNNLAEAEAVIKKAVNKLGGEKYLNIKNSVGEGKFSLLKAGRIISFQAFTDIIVYPEKERTDFIERGAKTVQVNTGEKGWFYDEMLEKFDDQNKIQINSFKRSFRSHYNYLLRGSWKGKADLSYVGKRPASLGKRNDVLKLTFEDGFEVEFEFSDEGLPMKSTYTVMNSENLPVTEENRFAQFILENGILAPFVIDHFTNDEHTFRVNYQSMDYNKSISDEIFVKPDDPKKLRKKLKF